MSAFTLLRYVVRPPHRCPGGWWPVVMVVGVCLYIARHACLAAVVAETFPRNHASPYIPTTLPASSVSRIFLLLLRLHSPALGFVCSISFILPLSVLALPQVVVTAALSSDCCTFPQELQCLDWRRRVQLCDPKRSNPRPFARV